MLKDTLAQNLALTVEESNAAVSEGWDIFFVDGDEKEPEIQRDDEAEIFTNDLEAWDFVIKKAIDNSWLHKKALRIVKEMNPSTFDYFAKDKISVENLI